MRRLRAWAAALGIGIGLAVGAQAATSDSLTVTITPNAYYDVDIDTGSGGLDLGTVNLGQSTWTVRPATVTINSTYAQTDLKLAGQIASGGTAWTFDDNTVTQDQDKLAAWAVFTDTSVAASPTQGSGGAFSGGSPGLDDTDVIDTSQQDVGDTILVQRRFVRSTTALGYKSMEDIPSSAVDPAASRSHLWLRFRLPSATTSSAPQQITITLTAGGPN